MSNLDRYIDDFDLRRFSHFLHGNTRAPTFYYTDDLPSLESMFPDEVYYAILHKRDPHGTIGHWVLLIRWDETTFEYFDCLGHPAPAEVQHSLDNHSELHSTPLQLIESGRMLMNPSNTICGKWCIFRLMTIPNSLAEFYNFFDILTKGAKGMRKITPDAIVNFIVNIPKY